MGGPWYQYIVIITTAYCASITFWNLVFYIIYIMFWLLSSNASRIWRTYRMVVVGAYLLVVCIWVIDVLLIEGFANLLTSRLDRGCGDGKL